MNAISKPTPARAGIFAPDIQVFQNLLSQAIRKQQKLNFQIKLSNAARLLFPSKMMLERTRTLHSAVLLQLMEVKGIRNALLTATENTSAQTLMTRLTPQLSRLLNLNRDTILLLHAQARSTLLFRTFEGIGLIASEITDNILAIHKALSEGNRITFREALCMN